MHFKVSLAFSQSHIGNQEQCPPVIKLIMSFIMKLTPSHVSVLFNILMRFTVNASRCPHRGKSQVFALFPNLGTKGLIGPQGVLSPSTSYASVSFNPTELRNIKVSSPFHLSCHKHLAGKADRNFKISPFTRHKFSWQCVGFRRFFSNHEVQISN